MDETNHTVIHEVMAKHCVSVAKVGITTSLNSNTVVLDTTTTIII